MRYTDPSGYYAEEGAGYVAPDLDRLIITNGFNYDERILLEQQADDVAKAYATQYNQENAQFAKRYGDEYYEELTPTEAFLSVHDGLVYVEKQNYNCPEGCWGRAITQNKIYIYKNATSRILLNHPYLLVHELAHSFENAMDQNGYSKLRWSIPYDTLNRLGFYGGPFIWQLSTDLAHGEIFADMFIGWVYDKWQLKKDGSMSVEGGKKSRVYEAEDDTGYCKSSSLVK